MGDGDESAACSRSPVRSAGATLAVLSAAQLLVMLSINSTIVVFPAIAAELDVSSAWEQFLVTAYALTFGSLLLLGSRVGDVVGRRRTMLVGLSAFVLGSLTGVLAPTGIAVVVARAVQGAGAACVAPAALAMLATAFPDGRSRSRALGVFSAATSAGAAGGVLLGGGLLALAGWRAVFAAVAALAAVVLLCACSVLSTESPVARGAKLDVPGAAAATCAVAALTLGINDASPAVARIPLVVVAVGLLLVFVLVEHRRREPLLPLPVLRLRAVSVTTIATALLWAAFASLFFHLSLLTQEVLGYSPLAAAGTYLPLTITAVLSSTILGARLHADRAVVAALAGAVLIGAGSLLLSRAEPGSSLVLLVLPAVVLTGAGLGAALVGLQVGVFTGVPTRYAGPVAGLFTTTQEVASALGTAALVTVSLQGASVADGISRALTAGAGVAVAGGAVLLLRARWPTDRSTPKSEVS